VTKNSILEVAVSREVVQRRAAAGLFRRGARERGRAKTRRGSGAALAAPRRHISA